MEIFLQILQIEQSNLVTINTHGKYHDDFDKLETFKAVEDVKYAHNQIEQNLGKQVIKVFTYPCGLYKQETIKALEKEGFIQNLTDNKINKSKTLDLSGLHRCYCLNDGTLKMIIKLKYRAMRYK